jgi:hypothetical protein
MTAYVIRNSRLTPGWQDVKRQVLNIAVWAISAMIAASGMNDIARTHYAAQRDRIAFNLAYINPAFRGESPEPLDQGYMRRLFDYSHGLARAGYPWHKTPPQAKATRAPANRRP